MIKAWNLIWLRVRRGHLTCIFKGLSECKETVVSEKGKKPIVMGTTDWPWESSREIRVTVLRNPFALHNKNYSYLKTTCPFGELKYQCLLIIHLLIKSNLADDFPITFYYNVKFTRQMRMLCKWRASVIAFPYSTLDLTFVRHMFSWKETTDQPKHTHFYSCSCQTEQIDNITLPRVTCHFSRNDKVGIHITDPDYIYYC